MLCMSKTMSTNMLVDTLNCIMYTSQSALNVISIGVMFHVTFCCDNYNTHFLNEICEVNACVFLNVVRTHV